MTGRGTAASRGLVRNRLQEIASLVYFTARSNADRLRALQRVYVGLYVLVVLTGGLVALAFRFVAPAL